MGSALCSNKVPGLGLKLRSTRTNARNRSGLTAQAFASAFISPLAKRSRWSNRARISGLSWSLALA